MPPRTISPETSPTSPNSKLVLPPSCDPPSEQNPPQQRVWIVFGASGHIGRSIVKAALAHNDLVTAVGKTHEDTIESLTAAIQPFQPSHVSHPPVSSPPYDPVRPDQSLPHPPLPPPTHNPIDSNDWQRNFLPLLTDIRIRPSVASVFHKTLQHWGRYDIVANCAGYGVVGACEEQDEWEIRNQFEVNFWGVLNIVQESLPYFRERGAGGAGGQHASPASGAGTIGDGDGHAGEGVEGGDEEDGTVNGGRYLIFSSTSGALGVPGLGPYCATKYAVEGLVESLLYETAGFDVKATLVEPGHVRRDDVGGSVDGIGAPNANSVGTAPNTGKRLRGKGRMGQDPPPFGHFSILQPPPHSPYASPTSPAHHAKRVMQWLGEKQPTSAVKAAELVWQLGHCRYPPLRLLLGAFAVESVRERMRGLTEEIEDWRGLNFGDGDGEGGEGRGGSKKGEKEIKDEGMEDGEGKEEEEDGDVMMEDEETEEKKVEEERG